MSRTDLLEAFAGFPDRLADVAGTADAALALDPRLLPPGEWGPSEVVRHLIAVESDVWVSRLADLARSDDPSWSWTEPGLAGGFDEVPLASVLAAFAAARAQTAATVAALDDAGWSRSGTHATYGRLDVAGLLELAIEHDESHLEGLRQPRTR